MNNIYGWYHQIYTVKPVWAPVEDGEQVHFVIDINVRLLNGKKLGDEFGKMAIESLV